MMGRKMPALLLILLQPQSKFPTYRGRFRIRPSVYHGLMIE